MRLTKDEDLDGNTYIEIILTEIDLANIIYSQGAIKDFQEEDKNTFINVYVSKERKKDYAFNKK